MSIGFVNNKREDITKLVKVEPDFMHGLCEGATGSGKTASFILPVMDDRLKRGHGVLIYTYKGHEHKKIKYLANRCARLNDVIEVGKPFGSYINILELFTKETLQNLFLNLLGSTKDNYWELSASRLGINILEILRSIYKIKKLYLEEFDKDFDLFDIELKDKKDEDSTIYSYPFEEPTFKTLAKITKSPAQLKRFFKASSQLVKDIEEQLESIDFKKNEKFIKKALLALYKLMENVENYKDYSISEDSSDASGNNGVLQVLNNAVFDLASKEFINSPQIDLIEKLNSGAIVIIDIESIDKKIHSILLTTILSKLSLRVRNDVIDPVSIFVDEANRILDDKSDIYSDTLRESKTELILAIQNEEQMIEKFGETRWRSIYRNFKHRYKIDENHNVTYNGNSRFKPEPLIIKKSTLLDAEIAFNSIKKNRELIERKFLLSEPLSDRFIIDYDPKTFEQSEKISIVSNVNKLFQEKKEVEYVGVDIKKRVDSKLYKLKR